MKKQLIIAAVIFTILLITLASAAPVKVCLVKGEKIRFSKCHPGMKDYTCGETRCQLCVDQISPGIFCPSNSCGALGGTCSSLNSTIIDVTAPEITINSPLNNEIYNIKSLLIDIELDETGSISYLDNLYGNDRWLRLCSNCDSYSRKKSFKEGLNNITFKAVDVLGHASEITRTFIIDSMAPRIHKTEPRSGYASGAFEVQYSEDNVEKITLYYGNNETGFRNFAKTDCVSGKNQWCSFVVNLKDYDNEKIQYYFEVEDIAGAIKKSQIRQNMNVDTTFPILNNPSSFYIQGLGRDARYVYFNFSVTEANLAKVIYSYVDSRNKTREVVLCSRLDKNNLCESKKAFIRGNHSITIEILDKAGNMIGKQIDFTVDY